MIDSKWLKDSGLLDVWDAIRRSLFDQKEPPPANPLDAIAANLGEIDFTGRELMEGLVAIGGKGSGKTSCMAGAFRQLYEAGWCGHILTVKTEEFQHQIRLLREAGRLDDVIVIGPGYSTTVVPVTDHKLVSVELAHTATISAVAHEFERSGSNVEAVAQLFGTLMELVEGHSSKGHDGKSQFFQRSALNAVRMATPPLAALGLDYLNFLHIGELIKSAPVKPGAQPENNAFWQVFKQVHDLGDTLTPEKREDIERAYGFFTGPWARLAEETRSSIIATVSSMAELFSLSPLREMFCEKTTVRPSDCWEKKKILLHAATIHGNGIVGKMIQTIWKYLFMRDAERRDAGANCVPCFQIEDEFQETIVKNYDCQFHGISRSKLIANIVMTQTLSSIHTALGNKHESNTLIANLRNRIIMAVDDPETMKTCSEWIGQTTKILPGPPREQKDPLNIWSNWQPGNWHSTRGPEIEPAEFARLKKGGPPYWEAEAFVYKGGADMGGGKTYRRVMIPQFIG